MGFIDKMKNLFTEEVEVEVDEKPIKKEVKQVEIPAPTRTVPVRKEEVVLDKEENISDATVLNKEEKFKVPVYFDDKDFDDLEKPAKKVEVLERPKLKPIEQAYHMPYKPVVEEKKIFKPSPIISPVYGVLDQNYTKDDIVPKSENKNYIRREEKVTVDDVRNKAFGTLEDELEDTMFGKKFFDSMSSEEEDYENDIDIFSGLDEESDNIEEVSSREEYRAKKDLNKEELDSTDLSKELEKQKQKIEEINSFIKDKKEEKVEKEEKEDKKIGNIISEIESIEDGIKPIEEDKDELGDSELFNLMDSMYEKEEE